MAKKDDEPIRPLLQTCIKSKDAVLRDQASFNLSRFDIRFNFTPDEASVIRFPKIVSAILTNISLSQTAFPQSVYLTRGQGTLFSKEKTAPPIFSFEKTNGSGLCFKRFRLPKAQEIELFEADTQLKNHYFKNLIPSNSGYYLKDPKNRFLIKVDSKGRLEEVVRVFRF